MQASHDCETFTRVSHDSREIFLRASHDSLETFVRVSHDARANFNQFYFSQLSLEMVLFMSHICRIVRDICDDLATVLRFSNDPKFSDRQVWTNSADPDQTAPRSSLIRVFTVCYSIGIFLTKYPKVLPLCLNFR